jgi:D-alanyl-D-alanine carboxypeptidase/D-alanyl-D-alanine-endopeptidase (penicillin-binding protein 4)
MQLSSTSRAHLRLFVISAALVAVPYHAANAQVSADAGMAPAVRAIGKTATPPSPQQHRGTSRRRATPHRTPVRTATVVAARTFMSPRTSAELTSNLAAMLHASTRGGAWGVMVVSLTRGDTLFSENPDQLLKPASTMKLMTTALALDRFGPDYTIPTFVLRDADASGGTLNGNLYLRGGGDPSLSLRFWQNQSPMDALAKQIADAGIRHLHGDIIADESAFSGERIPYGWKSSYLMSAYAAPISALSLNENLVWVVVRPENGRAVVELEPASTALPITSTVQLTSGSRGRVVAHRTAEGVSVSGSIGASSGPRRYSLVVEEPPAFAAGALAASLRQAGVQVDGAVRAGVTPPGATPVAQVRSLPLANMVSYMNRESINHFAELLYRDAAHDETRPGSAATGLAALRDLLARKAGANPQDVRVADGSGLSEADSLTARTMVRLLSFAQQAPWRSVFHASLPVAGESELLERRMRSTPAQGNLHAKTGTTNTVIALAGYVTAMNGEVLAFDFMYNGADRWNAKSTIDRIGATLANFYRE